VKYKLEYIWLDGYEPVPNLRSKTKIVDFETEPTLEQLPLWNFDGSSTRQADGSSSDCFLEPVALFPDPARAHGRLVMCEVLLPDGSPHPSNSRAAISDDPDAWFGFEQEYFLYKDGAPLGFPKEGFPPPQGEYYTGVGFKNVGDVARQIVDEHIDLCIEAGITIEGVNAEVGVPDLRQGREARGRRALDRAVPHAPPLRAVRRRRELASEAARRRGRLERLRATHELLDEAHARDRRRGVLRRTDGRLRRGP
jgi:glutamine synthetase